MIALIFLIVVAHSAKNVALDIAALVTGRTPPSHERQMARIARGTARRAARPHGTMGSFFADAYGDAWEAAHDWRERKAHVAARNRRAKWAAEDAEFAKRTPAPVNPTAPPKSTEVPKAEKVDPNAVPVPKQDAPTGPTKEGGDGAVAESVAPVFSQIATQAAAKTGETPGAKLLNDHDTEQDAPTPGYDVADPDRYESEYQRYAMRIRNGGKAMTSDQVQKDLGLLPEEADGVLAMWSDRYKTENASKDELKAVYATECAEAMKLHDAGRENESQFHIYRAADAARKMGITSEEELFALFQETQAALPQPSTPPKQNEAQSKNTAELAPGPTAEIQKEVPPVTATTTAQNSGAANAETIGLRAGLAFLDGMATQCTNGAANTEISTTSLAAGEVGPGVTGPMAQAQELLNAAAALFAQARVELEKSITVKEAYEAAPDAGNKQFLTTD